MERRLAQPLSRELTSVIKKVINIQDEDDINAGPAGAEGSPVPKTKKQAGCQIRPRAKERKTKVRCSVCDIFVCMNQIKDICD